MNKKFILSFILASFIGLTSYAETIESKHYQITDKGVFYLSEGYEPELLSYANPKAFIILDDDLVVAKDDKHVYIGNDRIYSADVLTFNKMSQPFFFEDKEFIYQWVPQTILGNFLKWKVDVPSFEFLPVMPYGKDKSHIYLARRILEKVDHDSFIPFDKVYYKDYKNVYYWERIMEGVDPTSFVVIDTESEVSKDKNHVYYENRIVDKADPNTVEFIAGIGLDRDRPLFKDLRAVFLGSRIIEDADPKAFVVVDGLYSKDNKNIFYGTHIIKNADYLTFEVLSSRYGKDANYIYWDGEPIDSIDVRTAIAVEMNIAEGDRKSPSEIRYLTFAFVIKDKFKVYNRGKSTDLDVDTFQLLAARIGKDKEGVYFFYDDIIQKLEADPQTFTIVNDEIAKDKSHVYEIRSGKPFLWNTKDWDVGTFEVLVKGKYYKDKKKVYSSGMEIIGADTKTFNALNPVYSKDSKSVFFGTEKIKNANPSTFIILDSHHFSHDDHNVYYQAKVIKGADIKTFEVLDKFKGKDKNGCYEADKKVACE